MYANVYIKLKSHLFVCMSICISFDVWRFSCQLPYASKYVISKSVLNGTLIIWLIAVSDCQMPGCNGFC